jgi:hypothetical protein
MGKFDKVSYFIAENANKKQKGYGWSEDELKELCDVLNDEVKSSLYEEQEQLEVVKAIIEEFGSKSLKESLKEQDHGLELIKEYDTRQKYIKNVLKPWNNTKIYNNEGLLKKLDKYPIGYLLHYYLTAVDGCDENIPIELIIGQLFCNLGSRMAGVKEGKIQEYQKIMYEIDNYKRDPNSKDVIEEEYFGAKLDSQGKWDEQYNGPGYWAKNYIKTSSKPFTTNLYTILIAQNGSGKDVGNLGKKGKHSSTPATKEGLMDYCKRFPNNLNNIEELQDYMGKTDYSASILSKAKKIYQSGDITETFSDHNGVKRDFPYIAPSINAKTQPETWIQLKAKFQEIKTDGTARRFLICGLDREYNGLGGIGKLRGSIVFNGEERRINRIEDAFELYDRFEARYEFKGRECDNECKSKNNGECSGECKGIQADKVRTTWKNYLKLREEMSESEKNDNSGIHSVAKDYITFISYKFYAIINPKKDSEGYGILDDEELWDAAMYTSMWFLQQAEKYLYEDSDNEEKARATELFNKLNKSLRKKASKEKKSIEEYRISIRDIQQLNVLGKVNGKRAGNAYIRDIIGLLERYGHIKIEDDMVSIVDR